MINCIRKLGSVIKIENLSFFNRFFIGNQNNSKTFHHNGDKLINPTIFNINGDQMGGFKAKNQLLAHELTRILKQPKNSSLTIEVLETLQEKFNAVETDFEQIKLSYHHINEIREFPSTAIIYYELIIGIYEKQGRSIVQYIEKKQYYEKLISNNNLK